MRLCVSVTYNSSLSTENPTPPLNRTIAVDRIAPEIDDAQSFGVPACPTLGHPNGLHDVVPIGNTPGASKGGQAKPAEGATPNFFYEVLFHT